jgi:hypothetical protein
LDYALSLTVYLTDGTWLGEIESSSALSTFIEICSSAVLRAGGERIRPRTYGPGLARLIAPSRRFSHAAALVVVGEGALLANLFDRICMSVWPLLTIAGGSFVLFHRRLVRISGMTLRVFY